MWVLLDRGDAAIVPSPSYPIHIYGPLFAGADLRQVPMRSLAHPEEREDFAEEFFDRLTAAYDIGWPKPRVLVLSFPHNPTGAVVELPFMQRVVDFCREREMIAVHDFAYADVGFDGYRPPSILQAEGAKECAVELYSMTKSFSMAGWRCAFLLGNAEVVQALVKLKSYLDYGMFQPVQIAATVTINEAADFPAEVCATYQSRRDALIDGLGRIGWDDPQAERLDVRVGADPRAVRRDGLRRVLLDGRARRRRRAVARRRVRPRRRGLRPLRADREREAHRPGHPQPPRGPAQARADRRRFTDPSHAGDTPAARVRYVPRSMSEHGVAAGARPHAGRAGLAARPAGCAGPGGEPDRGRARGRDGDRHPRARRGRAIDELVVALPESVSVDLLAKEIGAVDGVAVEHVRVVDDERADSVTAVLQLAALIAETAPGGPPAHPGPRSRPGRRCRLGGRRAGLRGRRAARHAARPRMAARVPRRQRAPRPGVPGDEHARRCDVGPPARRRIVVATGRSARAVHERERQRVATLARIVDHLV